MPELPDLFFAQLAVTGNVGVSLQFPPTPYRQLGSPRGMNGADRKGNFLPVVKVPIFLRGAKGKVGFLESNCEKEGGGIFSIFPQGLFRLPADQSIHVGLVGHFRAFRCASLQSLALEVLLRRIAEFRITVDVVDRIDAPGNRILRRGTAAMQDLPDRPGMVTVLLEQLREGDRIGNGLPEVGTQVPYPDRVRTTAGHQRETGRAANGQLTIRPLEKNALSGELVQVRGDCGLVAIATQGRPQIIDRDKQDVGPVGAPQDRRQKKG